MILVKIDTPTDSARFEIPELPDLTLADIISYAQTVGKEEPQILKDIDACHDPARLRSIEDKFRQNRIQKERYEQLRDRYREWVTEQQQEVADKAGGWDAVHRAELDWCFKNLRYFMKHETTGQPVSDEWLFGLPIQQDGDRHSVFQLFEYVKQLMGRMVPQGEALNWFEVDGERYYLPQRGFPKNTLGEYVEMQTLKLEADRMDKAQVEALPRVLAVMCRKQGEALPVDSHDRDEWIEARAKVMGGVRADIALAAAFFFANQRTFSTGVFRILQGGRSAGRKRANGYSRSTAGTR